MSQALQYIEPLSVDELQFLQAMELKDRKMYWKVYNVLMVMSFVIPFIGSWYRAVDGNPNAFSKLHFFATAAVLLAISTAGTYTSYHIFLRKVQADIKQKTKTIDTCYILRKQYMPQNNTYYFFINSSDKLSIEVPPELFHTMVIGDELSLEFTTHSRLYLGYF